MSGAEGLGEDVRKIAAQAGGNLPRIAAPQWYGLFLLTLVFAINSLDRTAVIVVLEPIKREFHLADGQLGLLTGLAFGATYAVCAIPLGLLADRVNRRNLLAALLAVWSLMTAACGLAQNFAMLMAARMIVGAAESGASPVSTSLISDLFPPQRRATAVAIYFLGSPVGSAIGFLAGSAVAASFGWRMTFLLAGVPGLLLAALLPLIMRHPRRGAIDQDAPHAQNDGAGSVFSGLGHLFGNPVLLCVFAAMTLTNVVTTSFQAWFPSLLIREHGLALKTAGAAMAICSGVGGGVGVTLSGPLADWFAKGDRKRLLLFTAATSLIALICALLAICSAFAPLALAGLAGYCFVSLANLGPCFAVVLNTTPSRDRGVMIAALQISTVFIGAGLGPWAAGLLSDAYGGPHSLSQALMTTAPILLVAIGLYLMAARRVTLSGVS